MSEEILMNVTPMETRVALVEDGVLQEVFVERERSRGIVGNIYLGRAVRVLPGMQAAFVDIGLEKASYLHADDIVVAGQTDSAKHSEGIQHLLQEGDAILVQVLKDPLGTKGARVSGALSVSSRNLVYMPQSDHIGVSNKIESAEQRDQLKATLLRVLEQEFGKPASEIKGGYIIRTAAESFAEQDFVADVRYLKRLWQALEKKIDAQEAPSLVYEELHITERVMRDNVYPELEKIRVDNEEVFQRLQKFAAEFIPEYSNKLDAYNAERPMFDLFSIEEEIEKALGRKVELKSGGYLIIDQTEALTTIDINTGAFVGKRTLDETIFKTNLEAANALARQIRLRNLGGIIIVDFIDMLSEEHQRQVLRALEKAVRKDRSKIAVGTFTRLGLVEITRQRTRESLEYTLCEPCPVCQSRGMLRSAETVCSEIFREILRAARTYEQDKLLVLASEPVVDRLVDEDSAAVADLQAALGKSIEFQVEPIYTQEQYDVV
ncbi:MAG: ribonuclease G, partial [Pseudomonadales bacterium]|nr:ribonuclease G [Pseudomonadales bacterium]